MRYYFILLMLVAAVSFAQQTAGISGTVRDDRGNPISGARIAISNPATGSEVDCFSQADGGYQALNLQPLPNYTAEATHPRFSTISHQGIVLQPGAMLHLDFGLSPKTAIQIPPAGSLAYIVVSLLVAAFVTIFVTEPGKVLTQRILRACTWFWDKGYETLAPRFPTLVGLRGYRKRVLKSDLARIEHPVGPGESDGVSLSIDRAFAPIAVMAGDGEERIDLFPFAAKHNRFILLGGPGTGKTTLMKNLIVNNLSQMPNEKPGRLIPIFVVLREMSVSSHSVEQALVAALAKFKFKNAEQFLKSALENGRLLIVLDGLDEVGANRQTVSGQIRDFCQSDDLRDHPNRLIVTCRENSYRVHDLSDVIATVARVEPFSSQHMRLFLQGWPAYQGRVALRLFQQIQADPQILEICTNPLLLTLLAGLYLAKEKFYLPSSRKAFYDTAIRELLVERPARKLQRQLYAEDQKLKILQKIALNRLETVMPGEDPELLSRDKLLVYSREELGSDLKESDFRVLLDELDTINSIVKPAFEGGYVFGHRTFQEYLAAREAILRREEEQVVERFGERDELAEVLCFYCGLLKNIPTIDKILKALKQGGHALLAGKCILNVVETPSHSVIQEIVEDISLKLQQTRIYSQELDILSSLATRFGTAFDIARQRFSSTVEEILTSPGWSSAGLVSALSSNPKLSMKLIPGLLQSELPNRRIEATQLLYNLGTSDALQDLVQLVASGGSPEREWAAVWVSNLIQSRNAELRGMSDFFPERRQTLLEWPFEDFFPGRIAIPLIAAIGFDQRRISAVRNKCMLEVLQTRRTTLSRWRTHMWRRVGLYFAVSHSIKWLGVAGSVLVARMALIPLAAFAILMLSAQVMHKNLFIAIWPPRITMTSSEPITNLQHTADRISAELKQQWPPKAMGMARILPWNWSSEPSVPESAKEVVTIMSGLRYDISMVDLRGIQREELHRILLELKVHPATVNDFALERKAALDSLPQPRFTIFLASGAEPLVAGVYLIIMSALLLLSNFRRRRFGRRYMSTIKYMDPYMSIIDSDLTFISGIFAIAMLAMHNLGVQVLIPNSHTMVEVFLVIVGAVVILVAFFRSKVFNTWTLNPYLELVDDLLPLSEDIDNEASSVNSSSLSSSKLFASRARTG